EQLLAGLQQLLRRRRLHEISVGKPVLVRNLERGQERAEHRPAGAGQPLEEQGGGGSRGGLVGDGTPDPVRPVVVPLASGSVAGEAIGRNLRLAQHLFHRLGRELQKDAFRLLLTEPATDLFGGHAAFAYTGTGAQPSTKLTSLGTAAGLGTVGDASVDGCRQPLDDEPLKA